MGEELQSEAKCERTRDERNRTLGSRGSCGTASTLRLDHEWSGMGRAEGCQHCLSRDMSLSAGSIMLMENHLNCKERFTEALASHDKRICANVTYAHIHQVNVRITGITITQHPFNPKSNLHVSGQVARVAAGERLWHNDGHVGALEGALVGGKGVCV